MDASFLLRRHGGMVGIRQPWEGLWEDVSDLVLPRMSDFGGRSRGEERNLQQYDSFPMGALDKFAAAIEAGLMPRSTMWHFVQTGEAEIDDNHDVKVFSEELNRRIWRRRYSPLGHFVGQSHEVRLSLGLFGTGVMLVEPKGSNGTRYRAIHLSEVFIDENADGVIDTVHRKFALSARQAVQLFGDRTPSKILQRYNAGKIDEMFEFLHCVAPREDYKPGNVDQSGLPFAGFYVSMDGREIVREDGYNEQPYIVSRYAISTRERYGRSPAIQRLPDIRMLNEMKRTMIDAAAMALDPPVLSHQNVSEFDLVMGARNPGTLDDNGRQLVQAFNLGSQPQIAAELMRDTRDQIDDGFLGLYFRVLLENPNMTATQAMLIAQRQGQMTMPVIGRLQSEWLGPMIRRESGILFRQGQHPVMPSVLKEWLQAGNGPLEIRYESPLTRAARAEEGISILRAFEALAPMAQIDPTVYRPFDMAEMPRIVMEINGVPAKAIKSKEAVAAEQEQAQAMQQMGALLQAAPIAAETAKTMAQTQQIAGGSPRITP